MLLYFPEEFPSDSPAKSPRQQRHLMSKSQSQNANIRLPSPKTIMQSAAEPPSTPPLSQSFGLNVEMDDGPSFPSRPKHLPDHVPKTGELNCPTPAENANAESVKPCNGEGVLFRRKWRKKTLSSRKAEACDGEGILLQRVNKTCVSRHA